MRRNAFRRAWRVVAVPVATALILLLAFVVALQSEPAQDLLAQLLGRLASRRGLVVRVEGLRGRLPWKFSIDEISFDDHDGRWLTVNGIEVEAEPAELLFGRVVLPTLRTRALRLVRLPELAEPDDDEPPPPFVVDVGELRVDDLRLGARRIGDADAGGASDATVSNTPVDDDSDWSSPMSLHGSGRYGLRDDVLRGTFSLDAPDTTGLLPSALALRGGLVHASLVLDGYVFRPRGELVLSMAKPTLAAATADQLSLRLRGRPAPGIGSDKARPYELAIETVWSTPHVSAEIDPLLGAAVHLSSKASIAPRGDLVEVRELALEGVAMTVSGEARIEDARRLVVPHIGVRLTDLTKVGGLAHEQLTGGTLDITADVDADLESRTARATIAAQAAGLRLHDTGLDALAGPRPSLSLRAEIKEAGLSVAVTELRAEAAKASLTASGTVAHPGHELDGEIALDLTDLGDLTALAGTTLAGALRVEATVRGSLDVPVVEALAVTHDVQLASGPPFNGVLALRAENARALPVGNLHATLESGYGALEAESDFVLRPNESLTLENLALMAPGLRLAGDATVDLDKKLVDADLAGEFSDLKALSPLVGGQVVGSGDARIVLTGADAQAADVTAHLEGFKYEGRFDVEAGRVDLEARLRELGGEPGGTLRLAASDMLVGAASLGRVDLEADGTAGTFDVRANAQGRYMQAFRLRAAAVLNSRRGTGVARIRSFEGQIGDRALRLERELVVAGVNGGVSVEQLELSFAEARVTGSLRASDSTKLEGNFEIVKLPLDLATLLDPAIDLRGALSASVAIAGTTARPDVRITVAADDVSVGTVTADMPPITVRADARWSVEGLVAEASLAGSEATRFDLRAELPPGDGRMVVDLQGTADVALLNGLGFVGEDKIEGVLETRLVLSGTMRSPSLDGSISWRDGSYENAATGGVLKHIQARLVGEGTQLRLEQFEATDGEEGRVHAVGSIGFSEGIAAASYALDVRVVSAKVARLDELTAKASGELRIEGHGSAPRIVGSVDTHRAEIRVPERLPVEIVKLDNVVEKNVGAARQDRYAVPEPASTLPADLDLDIRVPGRVFVRGNDVDTEWQGKLHVGGTSAHPSVVGKLEIVRGSFRLLNVRFTTNEGTITFDGAEPIDPILAVTGEAKKNGVDGRVTVAGRASALDVKFSSDPPLPEDEVLARLLFGKDPRQLSPAESVQLAAAVAQLSGGGGPGIDPLGWLRRTFRVDTLDVVSSDTAGAGSALSVGKYVSESVFVSVNQGLTGQASSAGVSVEVTRGLSLESHLGSDQEGSLGLSWKWNY